MLRSTCDFVQRMFRKYYTDCHNGISLGQKVEEREFAAFLLNERIMIRHRGFRTIDELKDFLCSTVPSDVYYSSARYEQPDASEMGLKGWIGADLIFDIDADHISTSCDKIHDEWTCSNCDLSGRGEVPQKCPSCGSEKSECNTWPCDECLQSAKTETVKLLDILLKDFGFSEKDVHAFFSGHRGYHVHIENEAVEDLDTLSRKEIVDYVRGLGFDQTLHGFRDDRIGNLSLKEDGWRGRIARGLQQMLVTCDAKDRQTMHIGRNATEILFKNKELLLKNIAESRSWGSKMRIGPQTWRKLVEHIAKRQAAEVDTVVTTDIHRLIRMPGTLHGKTGLKKVEFPISQIELFEPMKSAVAFGEGAVCAQVSESPEFSLGDERFGPYKNERVKLPTAAALLLACKRRAEIIYDV